MELRVLTVGDVVGPAGVAFLGKRLRALKREKHIGFCIVNGENASMVGMTPAQAEAIFDAGADALVAGSAVFGAPDPQAEIERMLQS